MVWQTLCKLCRPLPSPAMGSRLLSIQRQFKTVIPQGCVLSPTIFNIYTADIIPPRAPVQVMAYADDITITFTNTITLPNSEQTNLLSSNHTYTKSTPNHIHAPSATHTHDTHHLFNCTNTHTKLSPWICGQATLQ